MSLSILRPTNMSWVLVQGCICPRSDSVCIRPEDYTKPVECLNAAHLGSFPDHLLAKPCGTGNNGDDNNVLRSHCQFACAVSAFAESAAVGRKLRAEMGIAGGSGGGGGPRESAGNEVEEGMEVHSTD
uniref:Uncharacterized protein n=1 Tax=Globodera pallida TaxID=36090 RepID=A0A183CBZ5_GLOPA